MDGESRLLHSRVLDHVHVVEPDVLHAAGEVLSRHQPLAHLQEVVQAPDVYLQVITGDWCVTALSVQAGYITPDKYEIYHIVPWDNTRQTHRTIKR